MRIRYQLVVALLVISLMVSCFIAGREFGALTGSASTATTARLVTALLGLGTSGTAAAEVEDGAVTDAQITAIRPSGDRHVDGVHDAHVPIEVEL